MLAALLFLVASQEPTGPEGPIYSHPPSYALFEFAPANGAGMTATCAGTAPTGAKGEAMTFTRATSATCLKGNIATGIANGDMLTLTSGQPRIMPGGDGSGPPGYLGEGLRINLVLRSESMENASWANFTAGSGTNPTKGSADTDIAPDGNTTAERVTFNATGAADSSGLQQTVFSSSTVAGSIFARGNATTASGTFDLCVDNATTQTCSACTYVLGSWTRCMVENVGTKNSGKYYVGNLSSLNGGTTRSQQTVTLWGGQGESGNFASSYIATAGSTVQRNADVASFPVTLSGSTVSISATWYAPNQTAASSILQVFLDSNNFHLLSTVSATKFVRSRFQISGASHTGDNSTAVTLNAFNNMAMAYDGTNKVACLSGVCVATAEALSIASGSMTVYIAGSSTTGAGGVMRRVCIDPNPTRCR